MSRRKNETVHVPADKAEAEQMIAEYTELERSKMLEELAADEAIAKVKEQRSTRLTELEAEARPLFAGLKAWWETGGKDEVAGRKRSAELGSATIGIRLTPPTLKTERKVTFATVLEWLTSLRWSRRSEFLRHKVELNKEAISKAIRSEPAIAEKFKGRLRVDQVDEFFIDTGLDAETLKTETAAS